MQRFPTAGSSGSSQVWAGIHPTFPAATGETWGPAAPLRQTPGARSAPAAAGLGTREGLPAPSITSGEGEHSSALEKRGSFSSPPSPFRVPGFYSLSLLSSQQNRVSIEHPRGKPGSQNRFPLAAVPKNSLNNPAFDKQPSSDREAAVPSASATHGVPPRGPGQAGTAALELHRQPLHLVLARHDSAPRSHAAFVPAQGRPRRANAAARVRRDASPSLAPRKPAGQWHKRRRTPPPSSFHVNKS